MSSEEEERLSSNDESENDTLPEAPARSQLRPLRRRPISPSGSDSSGARRNSKSLSRSASLTVADFTSQWNEVFRMFDANLDGLVSCDELGSKMRSLGYNATQTEVEDLVHEWDKEDKGALSLIEFTLMMNSSRFQHNVSSKLADGARDTEDLLELKAAFDLFDRDKNGFLDAEEVKMALTLMGEDPTDLEVAYVVAEADTDQDGVVSFKEFCSIVCGRSLSPKSPFYFRGKSALRPIGMEKDENSVKLEYQTDHVSSRPG